MNNELQRTGKES